MHSRTVMSVSRRHALARSTTPVETTKLPRFCTSVNQEEAIVAETAVSRCHLTPELRLRLITPTCRLWSAREEELPFPDPFWAFYWPGGQALARYLLDCPAAVRGKRVLDFGCGGGGAGLAAFLSGASSVTFNDVDPVALKAVEVNLKLNYGELDSSSSYELEERSLVTCPAEQSSPAWDAVLVGDMFYDAAFAASATAWLAGLHSRGSRIFIGDPGRSSFREAQELEGEPSNPKGLSPNLPNATLMKSSVTKEKLSLTRVAKYALQPHTVLENRGFSAAFCWSTR